MTYAAVSISDDVDIEAALKKALDCANKRLGVDVSQSGILLLVLYYLFTALR